MFFKLKTKTGSKRQLDERNIVRVFMNSIDDSHERGNWKKKNLQLLRVILHLREETEKRINIMMV